MPEWHQQGNPGREDDIRAAIAEAQRDVEHAFRRRGTGPEAFEQWAQAHSLYGEAHAALEAGDLPRTSALLERFSADHHDIRVHWKTEDILRRYSALTYSTDHTNDPRFDADADVDTDAEHTTARPGMIVTFPAADAVGSATIAGPASETADTHLDSGVTEPWWLDTAGTTPADQAQERSDPPRWWQEDAKWWHEEVDAHPTDLPAERWWDETAVATAERAPVRGTPSQAQWWSEPGASAAERTQPPASTPSGAVTPNKLPAPGSGLVGTADVPRPAHGARGWTAGGATEQAPPVP